MPGNNLYQHGSSHAFGLQALKRHPGVTPIVVIIGGLCVFVTGACSYFMATKTDVQTTRNKRWENVNLGDPSPQKVFTFNQQYRPMPELKKLLDEINEADK